VPKVEVTVIDVWGNTEQDAFLPADVPVRLIIIKLLAMMKIPDLDYGDDRTIHYFMHRSTGRIIDNNMTLDEAGVQHKDVIYLSHKMFSNCCPNCSIKRVLPFQDRSMVDKGYLNYGIGFQRVHVTIDVDMTIADVEEKIVLHLILPSDVPVKDILGRLVDLIDLSPHRDYTWSIRGRDIVNTQSLHEVGIRNGDALELRYTTP